MKITQANVYENSFNARRTTACGMFFTRDIIETKMGVHVHVYPSFQQQSIGMCHEFNQCILHTYSKVPGQKFGEIEDNIDDFESVEEFFRNIFFKRSTFVVSVWSFGFCILATTANDLGLRRIFYPRIYPLHFFYYLNSSFHFHFHSKEHLIYLVKYFRMFTKNY